MYEIVNKITCMLLKHKWEETGVSTVWMYRRSKKRGGDIPCGVEDVEYRCDRCGKTIEVRKYRSNTARRKFYRNKESWRGR